MVTFSFTGFSGLEEFLVASGKDGPFFTGEFVSWGDVADRGVKAHGVLEHLSRPQERWPARPWKPKPSLKGSGFVQPLAPHEHWHVDVSYINISGTFFYLCSLLDGCSRSIVHGELREAMTEAGVEIILQRGLENIRTPNLESSPTTDRSSLLAISKSSSASPV